MELDSVVTTVNGTWRVWEKAGYSVEGRGKGAVVKEGQVLGELVYARVDPEDRRLSTIIIHVSGTMMPDHSDLEPEKLRLTRADVRASLQDHMVDNAQQARAAHDPIHDYTAMLRMLENRKFIRYPVSIEYDSAPLQVGQPAQLHPRGDNPREGFVLHVHPFLKEQEQALPLLIAYHLVKANYGKIATQEDAELYGATLLGLEVDDYRHRLLALTEGIPPAE